MKVLTCNDINLRNFIESWTQKDTFPHVIKFIEDADGNFVTSLENLSNPVFKKLDSKFKSALQKVDALKTMDSIDKCLSSVCNQIDFKEKIVSDGADITKNP